VGRILILQKPALLALKDYEKQKKAGKDPVFDPVVLGIKDADFWEHEFKRESTPTPAPAVPTVAGLPI
jgi:AGCS family alanine or glycine:cation symporter